VRQYKIEEAPHGVFKIYKRGWIFWNVYGAFDAWFGWEDSEYDSYENAFKSLKKHMEKDSHKKKRWYFYE
jgi:hypothetical protein